MVLILESSQLCSVHIFGQLIGICGDAYSSSEIMYDGIMSWYL